MSRETASQTAGPFVHIGLLPEAAGGASPFARATAGPRLWTDDTPGARLVIEGQVIDGEGQPLTDVLVELWQSDAAFSGWGRSATAAGTGLYRFETLEPQAAFVSLFILARGINLGLHTRLYFEDRPAANAADPVLRRLTPERRATLLARPLAPGHYRFDIRLQGEGETVFFDL
ncbi:protocatechuate 3,4-dioxygenase subunit alpha [Pelomonas sp. V22]|uniref:protocatechuate 3,4-dioxygenase subunit alpha n=1 Tax=Pelomonas sp. V22 TaxID=2822139 RepID=UPI0024A8004E|nr:protocatechuate 3,4-dioxygenase subunit alpha [Pelomonas sp. V22]MDI4635807.1 protocatechuate 3,4-dioxygenase subunit alpha [Pelomonas sp. V22]